MTETLIVQKVAYILASLCEGEWFSYLLSVPGKVSYKLEKTGKNSEKLFHYFFLLKQTQSEKNFEITFSLKPAQLLAKTLCPYLFWVLRNLHHKFQKLAHVTKSAKKNIGAMPCCAWPRAETFNGLQKVLKIV